MVVVFNDTATTEIYTLSLHDALPILRQAGDEPGQHQRPVGRREGTERVAHDERRHQGNGQRPAGQPGRERDRKSTRLNSSHANISYAVFSFEKKQTTISTFGYGCTWL